MRCLVRSIRDVNCSFSIKPSVKLSISLSTACGSLVLCDLRISRLPNKVPALLLSCSSSSILSRFTRRLETSRHTVVFRKYPLNLRVAANPLTTKPVTVRAAASVVDEILHLTASP